LSAPKSFSHIWKDIFLDSSKPICDTYSQMNVFSTRVAAKMLGLHPATLARYVAIGKLPSPKMVATGSTTTHIWTDAEVEHVRKLLPKIANGRKTRYQKLREKQKTQPGAAVPHKKKKMTKKK
jgi:hypothetical protein